MSFGFDLGRLKSDSIGMSYVDRFVHTGGSTQKVYTSEAYAFATKAEVVLTPGIDIPASTIPEFPAITKVIDQSDKKITITVNGGNVSLTLLVFVG